MEPASQPRETRANKGQSHTPNTELLNKLVDSFFDRSEKPQAFDQNFPALNRFRRQINSPNSFLQFESPRPTTHEHDAVSALNYLMRIRVTIPNAVRVELATLVGKTIQEERDHNFAHSAELIFRLEPVSSQAALLLKTINDANPTTEKYSLSKLTTLFWGLLESVSKSPMMANSLGKTTTAAVELQELAPPTPEQLA